ncbi:MAG TPA: nicotinamide-nucleotide amidohydrolase family protein [Steroidobacteraceae bacterium]|nr:nicotinamide-nucleotide amidohydrolase family protein [Steroidobacteraceae bacterium]
MSVDPALLGLAARVGQRALAAGRRIVTAESCTGGWIAKALTDIPGSSQWFECGYVTYSNAAKMRDLGVAAATLERHGAVSEQTVRAMAAGALRVSAADLALAVSGVAGPDGGTAGKPVGTVWLCVTARRGRSLQVLTEERHFRGDRAAVRSRSVRRALEMLLRLELRPRAV